MTTPTEKVFGLLKEAAEMKGTVTYGELSKQINEAAIGIGKNHLEYIRDTVCRKRGLPWLTIVATDRFGVLGDSWFPKDAGFKIKDESKWISAMRELVYATSEIPSFSHMNK